MQATSALRTSSFRSFSRAQIASLVATGVDYCVLFILAEFFHTWYVAATAWGALLGAITNFLMNRHWSFNAGSGRLRLQAIRYAIVSGGSLVLNTGGVFLVTEYMHLHYAVSVVIVALFVGTFFNYPLHRHYVYRI